MAVLVAYAGKTSVTAQIAARVARTLTAAGLPARSCPVSAAGDLARYGAVVIGGPLRWGQWQAESAEFVRANHAMLADRPVWLFGTRKAGRAMYDDPGEIAGLGNGIGARGYRVFSAVPGAGRSWLVSRMIRVLPSRDARGWAEVDAWARAIAADSAFAPTDAREPDRWRQPGQKDAPPLATWARAVDASRLSDRTAAAIETYLRTYLQMMPPVREEAAFRLVDMVIAQVSPPPPISLFPLDILATVLAARRSSGHQADRGPDPAGP